MAENVLFPPVPKELEGLSQEELRFWRLIDERNDNRDGTEDILLACGHVRRSLAFTRTWLYAKCEECEKAWKANGT
jgi:hypothetical protein